MKRNSSQCKAFLLFALSDAALAWFWEAPRLELVLISVFYELLSFLSLLSTHGRFLWMSPEELINSMWLNFSWRVCLRSRLEFQRLWRIGLLLNRFLSLRLMDWLGLSAGLGTSLGLFAYLWLENFCSRSDGLIITWFQLLMQERWALGKAVGLLGL